MYTTDYSITLPTDSILKPLSWHAQIYLAADFYMIAPLKSMALERFKMSASQLRSRRMAIESLRELFPLLEHVYEHNVDKPRHGLRGAFMDVLVLHAELLLLDHRAVLKPFENLVEAFGTFGSDFGMAMVKLMYEKWNGWRQIQCPKCAFIWADHRSTVVDVHCPNCKKFKEDWTPYLIFMR